MSRRQENTIQNLRAVKNGLSAQSTLFPAHKNKETPMTSHKSFFIFMCFIYTQSFALFVL